MTGFWSTETLVSRCQAGRLIKPFSRERIENCAYALRMGPQALLTGEDDILHDLDEGAEFRIPPGQFAQLLTEEEVRIPADALGLISMKSKVKALGLVNVSGFHVDPGFHGRLRFSVYNAGPAPVRISRGTPTFLIWYASLDSTTRDVYDGHGGRPSFNDADSMGMQGDVATPQALAERVGVIEKKISVLDKTFWILLAAVVAGLISIFGPQLVEAWTADADENPPPSHSEQSPQAD